jgi:hypothetical protein
VRQVVSNTGPLLHLHEAALVALLEHTGAVAIPRAVDSEMMLYVPEWQVRRPTWLTVMTVTVPYDAQAIE